eukprot:TRINITY_DN46619_c0_g2_i1.p1 TRINITY_DN46619_c0_g2~~TRINITY_DN46619_c0_g2_i1.p1  ORF type:complete len:331 (-),score=62.90 TRINITY_DN46619_c0_g2_i1:204-1196(-)
MCGKKVETQGESSQTIHGFQTIQEQLLHQNQQHQYNQSYIGGMALPQASSVHSWSVPPDHAFNPVRFSTNGVLDMEHLLPSPSYPSLNNRRAANSYLQFSPYDGSSSNPLGPVCSGGLVPGCGAGSSPFSLQAELGRMTTQEIMDAKALAASKSHSEAERRRRERINKHLARLRSLLPSTTKTDKASLLAEVIQHVKELKRQTSEIGEESPLPTEADELTIDATDEDGKFMIKASLCCDDRSDLLPDLIKTLKALHLRTLKAEITTLGGRMKNVLLITGEDDSSGGQHSIDSIQEALKAVMERTASDDSSSSSSLKRQRTNVSIVDHRSI